MPRRPKFPESPDFSNLQGLRPWAFSGLVPGDLEWLGDDDEVGAGSSGSVVRWMKKDQDGNILDEVAVKTIPHEDKDDFPPCRVKGLNQEAGLQSQLNCLGCESVVHLRGFKFSPTEDCSRLYLEYAPHGNLERLRFRYRCMQRYLPEAFLWRVFFSFAQACVAMHTKGIWTNLATNERYGKASTMLHFDIKLENVVLGNEPPSDGETDFENISLRYPLALLADFGSAQITGPDDPQNPRKFFGYCTDYHLPPEHLRLGVNWAKPPNGTPIVSNEQRSLSYSEAAAIQSKNESPGFCFEAAHNVWGFGKIMYDLLTLSNWKDLYDEMQMDNPSSRVHVTRLTEAEYYHSGEHIVPEIQTLCKPEYSMRLRELVRDCLRAKIELRPNPAALLERTSRGLNICIAKARERTGQVSGVFSDRVYYKGNEINRMEPGSPKWPASYNAWARIKDNPYPNETPLNPPRIFNPYRARDEKWRQDQRDADAAARARLEANNEQLLAELAVLKGKRKATNLEPPGNDAAGSVGNNLKKQQLKQVNKGGFMSFTRDPGS